MPHSNFNEYLLRSHPELKINSLNLSSIYEDEPLYFNANESESDTNEQLNIFNASPIYAQFKQQYATLVQKLNYWCEHHQILIKTQEDLSPEDDLLKPAFSLFLERLFDERNYYSIRKAILFNDGKRSLEELLLLLNDESIMRPIKEKTLLNLQQSIGVCADGTLTNIVDARDDLKEAHEGITFLITNTLRTLIQQHAIEHARATYSEKELATNTMHYGNAYSNYVATTYGIALKKDAFVSALHVPNWRLQQFALLLDELITPKVVLKSLMHSITGYIASLREQFHACFFKEHHAIPLKESSRLCNEGLKLMAAWNKKYDMLLPLNTNSLFQLSDDGTAVIPSPYDEAPLRKTMAQKFNALFLTKSSKRVSLKLNSGSNLIIEQGLYWKENDLEVLEFKSEELAGIERNQLDSLTDFYDYNELIETFPEHAHFLIHTDTATAEYSPLQLLERRYLTLLMALIDYHRLSKSQKKRIQSPQFAQLMSDYLSRTQQMQLLEKLGEHNLLSPEVLQQGWPSILATEGKRQIAFIELLLAQKRLTRKLCAQIETKEQELLGSNIIWLLIAHEHFWLIEQLIQEKLLSPEILAAAPKNGIYAGKNIFWLLAYYAQSPLLEQLLEQLLAQNLLTKELLAAKAKPTSNEAGISAIWLLVYRQCFKFIKKLGAQKLITTEMLATAPETGDLADRSFFWFLINYNQDRLLEKLFIQGLFTPAFLATTLPENSVAAGANNVWLLTIHQRFRLLKQLLAKQLLTTSILAAAPYQGDNAGVTTFWLLAKMNEIELINELCRQNILTTELLAAVPKDEEGTNAVYELGLHQHFPLLETLLNKGLLNKEIVAAAPKIGPDKDKNLIAVLMANEQFSLLEKLIEHKLVTPEALQTTLSDNIISILISKQQVSLVQKMCEQGLVESAVEPAEPSDVASGAANEIIAVSSNWFSFFSPTARTVKVLATTRLTARTEREQNRNEL